VGLIAGALVGWKMGSALGGGRGLKRVRDLVGARLDEISDEIVRDFDQQIDVHVRAVHELVARRRHSFAADLYHQFDLVLSLADQPELVDHYVKDAERFATVFQRLAAQARSVVAESMQRVS